jgi:Protein kinase domain
MSGKRSAQDYAGGVEKRLKAQQAARGESPSGGRTASTRSAPSLDSWEPPVPPQLHQLYGVERGSADEGDTSPHFFPDDARGASPWQPPAPCSATEACCARWQLCETRTRCLSDARLLRTIHDEDGARVCVVATRAYGAEGARQEVVYKRYEMRKEEGDSVSTLDVLVQEEIAMLRKLGGRSHTIPLLDSFRDPCGCPVLVMPYIDDFTPSLPSDVRCYMRQLLEALAFLHDDMGVMHRGVKRANILFSRSRQLQLIDFEGSCSVHEGALFARWGNNLYRAPEVAVKPAAPPAPLSARPPTSGPQACASRSSCWACADCWTYNRWRRATRRCGCRWSGCVRAETPAPRSSTSCAGGGGAAWRRRGSAAMRRTWRCRCWRGIQRRGRRRATCCATPISRRRMMRRRTRPTRGCWAGRSRLARSV